MKKAYYKKAMSFVLAGVLLMGMAPTTALAAEAKRFEHYSTGGFNGTVKWEVGQMLGCLKDITITIDCDDFTVDQHMDRVVVVRPSKTGAPLASVKNIYNMKAMTPQNGPVVGYVWDDKAQAFKVSDNGAYYAVSADGSQLNLYQGNAKLNYGGFSMVAQMADKNGAYGGTMVFNYMLVLSEEDEAYFLQNGTIPGCGNFKWTGLREMLLDSEAFSESAIRNNLKVVVEDKAPVEIDAFYYVENQPPYIYTDKLEQGDFSTGAYYNPQNAEPEYYIKLRDLAQLVNRTDYQFDISWNPVAKCMEIKTGKHYHPIGTEIKLGTGNRWADWVEANAIIDGKAVKLITDEYKQGYLNYTGTWIEDFLMIDGNYYTSLENVEKYLKIPVEVVNGQMIIGADTGDNMVNSFEERRAELERKGFNIPKITVAPPMPNRAPFGK